MPNHVTHVMTITGSKETLEAFREQMVTTQDGDEPNEALDFNGAVPMPDEIRDTTSGSNP